MYVKIFVITCGVYVCLQTFVRCHRAFLVNKNNIKEVDTKNRIIHFANGETCLMSTRMMKGL